MSYLLKALVSLVLSAGFARADAIDGDWCNQDGSQIFIAGSSIRLTDGTTLTGTYTRHQFSYVAPSGDAEEGKVILFVQRSEEEMRRVRDPKAMPEHADIWQRCRNTSFVPMRHTAVKAGTKS